MFIHSKKIIIVLFVKKRRDSLPNGKKAIDRNFKFVKSIIKENMLKQRIRFRFPKHETIDQLENAFIFDLKTHNDPEYAESYAIGLYDETCLRDKWDRDLTVQEKKN